MASTATKTATRKPAAQPEEKSAETPTATGGLGFALNVQRADVTEIKREAPKRAKEPNPTEEAVKHSRETGDVLAFAGLPNEDAVKKVTNFLRRAANDADHGIQIQTVQTGDTWTINFKSVDKKRDRKYTAADIRTWAAENGYPQYGKDDKLKITAEVRDAFKSANGFDKKVKKASAN